jgi:hypothetical protein
MMLFCPLREAAGVDEETNDLREAVLLVVKSDESSEPCLRIDVRKRRAALEKLVE